VLRDEADLELLAELAGVLDQTVNAAGLTSGSYLVLRELCRHDEPQEGHALAGALSADPNEVAELCGRLVQHDLAEVHPDGVSPTDAGRTKVAALETEANAAMKAYVLERPHTATVYGLVASMQAGRFTVEDLIAFLREGPGDGAPEEPPA
jgi:DNA-binding MarR family transcriptional regulator